MHRYFVALAALFVVRLIFPIPSAWAQIAPGEAQIAPSDVETPTGDVWPSREERIYIPQNPLTPHSVDDDANAPPSPGSATIKSKNTPLRHVPNNSLSSPRTDALSGKNCAHSLKVPSNNCLKSMVDHNWQRYQGAQPHGDGRASR
jgi:hypothetical protein